MKITHNKVGQNLNIKESVKSEVTAGASKNKESAAPQVPASMLSPKSEVAFSSKAQTLQKAKDIAMATPDVNQEKVAKFKQMIKEGTYKVDAEAVAERMLEEHLNPLEN